MWILLASATFVGFVHSLSPGHWLPIAVLAKTRKWSHPQAFVGATMLGLGHTLITVLIALIANQMQSHFFHDLEGIESKMDLFFGGGLLLFGLVYAFYSYRNHAFCHGDHSHHGPHIPKRAKSDYAFLFSLGMNPCVAALPVFLAAGAMGSHILTVVLLGFSLAVFLSLHLSTALAVSGLKYLDHPILEHCGEVITGMGLALTGVILLLSAAS